MLGALAGAACGAPPLQKWITETIREKLKALPARDKKLDVYLYKMKMVVYHHIG